MVRSKASNYFASTLQELKYLHQLIYHMFQAFICLLVWLFHHSMTPCIPATIILYSWFSQFHKYLQFIVIFFVSIEYGIIKRIHDSLIEIHVKFYLFMHLVLLSQISEDVGFELGAYHQILIPSLSHLWGCNFHIWFFISNDKTFGHHNFEKLYFLVNQLRTIHSIKWNLWIVRDWWWF